MIKETVIFYWINPGRKCLNQANEIEYKVLKEYVEVCNTNLVNTICPPLLPGPSSVLQQVV